MHKYRRTDIGGAMERVKDYTFLHLCVIVFSFTGVFAKFAANAYNASGLHSLTLYVFIALMLFDCVFYAFCWQKIIKRFDLNIGYANRSMYLVWAQIWAVLIFGEHLTIRNVVGMFIVMFGVIVVSLSAKQDTDQSSMVKREGGAS